MIKTIFIVLFLIIESPVLKAQYLLSFELNDLKGHNSCEIFYYVNDLQDLEVEVLFSEINNAVNEVNFSNNQLMLDSILIKIGIPLITPGFTTNERKCSIIDTLDFNLRSIFSQPNITTQIVLKNYKIELKLGILRFYGELCIFRPSVQVWSHLPLFRMIGTIVSLEIGPLNEKEKALLGYP